jgi:hypothetical protein
MEHLVEGGHYFTSQVFIWRLHQQPLKLGTVEESSRQAENVILAWRLEVAGFGLPGLLEPKIGDGHGGRSADQDVSLVSFNPTGHASPADRGEELLESFFGYYRTQHRPRAAGEGLITGYLI